MKLRNLLVAVIFIVAGLSLAQVRPDRDKNIIITPDGQITSRVDGSIISSISRQDVIKQNQLEIDAPIGTPFSWDNSLGFYSGGLDWTVRAVAVSGSDVYIGGNFADAVGDGNADYIVRYNQKNNTWHSLGSGLNGPIHAIAVSGNDVYVGGEFTDAGGNSTADYIARWDGNNWNALGLGLDSTVIAIAIQGSNVFVGGDFIGAGGLFEADYIARWDGSNWNSMGQFDGPVYALAVYGTSILAGGGFTQSSSANSAYFAVYNGSSWGSLGTNLNGEVRAIAVSGSDLYIGGAFSNAGGDTLADAIAHFDLDTYSGWQSLGNGIIKYDWYPNSIVTSLAANGKDVYVGGPFWNPYNSYFNSVAYWNGTTWDSLGTGFSGTCSALVLAGTDLFAGNEFGLMRWFGAYAEGLYGGVQKPVNDFTGFVEFNNSSDSTTVSIELNYGSGYTGIFNVFCYEDKIFDGTILPVANHRWIIQQNGLPQYAVTGNIRFKIVDLPDSSGIFNPGSGSIGIFQRSTPGRGQFNDLTPWSWYDFSTGEYVTPFTGVGEFAIGLTNTIDGEINSNEYGSHVEGENMQSSDGKTWYMRTDEHYMYFGISNYTDSSDAVNIYLDNSSISPVNYHWEYYGTQTGTGKDGLNTNLPFGADFFAYLKPAYDEYRYTDQFYGWIDSVSNSFIRSYSFTNNVFEFALPLSSLPVSTNQYNNPTTYFNWLGFLSNSGNISSRVPSNTNPSGILNDMVWYYEAGAYFQSFRDKCYTHIGPSLPSLGAIDCYEFTFYPQDSTTFINRTNGVWNIESDLWIYNGTLTFQNNDSVNVGAILTAGGTTNFSYNVSDAPLNVKYFLWQWQNGGTLNMNSGHYLTFVTPPINSSANFQGRDVFQNVVVNNPSKVYLGADMLINESLTLLNGNIQTITYDTFYVILNAGAIIGGSGYVEGSLVQWVDLSPGPNGGDSPDNLVVNFPVGTANGSSPVSIDFSSVTNGGKVTVQSFEEVHPNSVVSSESMKRYWKITKDNNLVFSNANITFNYLPQDFNTTFFEVTDEASMVVGKYDTGNWSFPTIGSRSPGGSNDGGSITISGVTSFSDFTIAKTESALPVELSSFTAKSDGNSVKLNWRTETEVSNLGFHVERRINIGEWNNIGFIAGSGNSNSPKEYSYTDKEIFAGGSKFQYRLKQVDSDGSFEYSDVVEVEVVPDQYELSQNYPNPFNPSTTIRFSLPQTTQIKINLYNMLGELVTTVAEGMYESGYHKVTFNASSLPSGTYIYRLESSDFVQVKKMILIK